MNLPYMHGRAQKIHIYTPYASLTTLSMMQPMKGKKPSTHVCYIATISTRQHENSGFIARVLLLAKI